MKALLKSVFLVLGNYLNTNESHKFASFMHNTKNDLIWREVTKYSSYLETILLNKNNRESGGQKN